MLHTLNPRLSDKDLIFIINDAADTVLTADLTFVPLLARVLPLCKCVKTVVLMTDRWVLGVLAWFCAESGPLVCLCLAGLGACIQLYSAYLYLAVLPGDCT